MNRREKQGPLYVPGAPPIGGGTDAILSWATREFEKIADALNNGRGIWLRLDPQSQLPDKVAAGLVGCFAANVINPGAAAGYYEYREGLGWTKL